MSAAALGRGSLLPQDRSQLGLGAAMALLAHGGLIAALALGLNWRLPKQDAVMSAELWSAVPQIAAPAPAPEPTPVAPPPPPAPERRAEPAKPTPTELAAQRDADIAVEMAAQRKKDKLAQEVAERDAAKRRQDEAEAKRLKQKLEEQRLAEDKAAKRKQAQQVADDKAREDKRKKDLADQQTKLEQDREAKLQEAQVAKQREENLKRMLGQAGAGAAGTGAANATGNAARDAAPSSGYAGRIRAAVKDNIVLPVELVGNPVAEVEVRCARDGTVISRRISKSSGNPVWDETVLRAIDKTRTMPPDIDGRIPATMILVFPRKE